MALPHFRYHPEPLKTGSVRVGAEVCVCCRQERGFIYSGPVYALQELIDCICPWCIADGTAAERFDAQFTDAAGVGGYGDWDVVPTSVTETVSRRTPGFSGWQQERWWTHCGDAGQFLGRAGAVELLAHGEQAIEAIRRDLGWDDGAEFRSYLHSLDAEGEPTAYLFRCTVCSAIGGYSDFT